MAATVGRRSIAARLVDADTSAVLAVTRNQLLFVRRRNALRAAVRRAAARLSKANDSRWPRKSRINIGKGAFSASMTGTVAYRAGGRVKDQLVWLDRSGKLLRSILPPDDWWLVQSCRSTGRTRAFSTLRSRQCRPLAVRRHSRRTHSSDTTTRPPNGVLSGRPTGDGTHSPRIGSGAFDLYQKLS